MTRSVTVRVNGSTVELPAYETLRVYDRAPSFGSVTVTRPLESSVTVRRTSEFFVAGMVMQGYATALGPCQ